MNGDSQMLGIGRVISDGRFSMRVFGDREKPFG
jgi:hypothetical protein